jgi:8-oxo-dGTP diphosphatase
MEQRKIGVGVGVLILNNEGKVLLGRRHVDAVKASSELKGAGQWTMPGGKLDFGESFEAGALRETEEETGLKLKKVKVIAVNSDQTDTAHYVTIGLFGSNFGGEPQVCEPDKITCWEWFDLNKLPSPLYEPSAKLLKNYLGSKFYIEQ